MEFFHLKIKSRLSNWQIGLALNIRLLIRHFNRHSNGLQCDAKGVQQWQENDTHDNSRLPRLRKSVKKEIRFHTSSDDLKSLLKAVMAGGQWMAIMRRCTKPHRLKKVS